jgi:hypothetical protein
MKEPESDLKHVPELMATYLQILQPVSTVDVSCRRCRRTSTSSTQVERNS